MERLSIRVRVWTIIIMLSLSVRQRIYLSASLLVALCIFTSVLGWLGQQSLLRNIQAFDATDAAISQVLEIDRNVQRLKGQSESYMHSGSTPVREDASRLLAAIITQIDEVAPLLPNGSFPYLLGEMRANLTTFGEQLQLASQERAIESSLVNTQLPRTITSVRSALRRIRDKAELSESAPALGLALDASTHVDAANTSMLQYVIHPNADDLTEMLASIDTASQKLAEYDGDPTMIEGELDTLDGALLAYRRLAVRTVQATRGYLYLSNVIMA